MNMHFDKKNIIIHLHWLLDNKPTVSYLIISEALYFVTYVATLYTYIITKHIHEFATNSFVDF